MGQTLTATSPVPSPTHFKLQSENTRLIYSAGLKAKVAHQTGGSKTHSSSHEDCPENFNQIHTTNAQEARAVHIKASREISDPRKGQTWRDYVSHGAHSRAQVPAQQLLSSPLVPRGTPTLHIRGKHSPWATLVDSAGCLVMKRRCWSRWAYER